MYTHFLNAQSYKDNIVKLTAVYPDHSEKSYFGFICAEETDSLYIVTTFNLLLEYYEIADSISAEYFNSKSSSPTKAVWIFRDRTCLLLKTKKPDDFIWNDEFCFATSVEIGNSVGIIGRYGQWNDFNKETIGSVTNIGKDLIIDIPSRNAGTIGAPVIYNDCIAGMTVNDEGNRITAVEYRMIKIYLDSYFNINDKEYDPPFNLPYLILGVKTGPFIRSAYSYGSTMKLPDSHNLGFYLQTGITPLLSVRYENSYSDFNSYPYKVWSGSYQFRNKVNTNAFRLLLTIGDKIERADMNFFYEVAFNHHNPELRVSENVWSRLDRYDEFKDSYSDKFASYCGGIEFNGLVTKRILLGFEFSLEKNRNKYMLINPIDPFAINKKNVWIFNLNVQAGIVFGNKEKPNRFLKPDKINPFRLKF